MGQKKEQKRKDAIRARMAAILADAQAVSSERAGRTGAARLAPTPTSSRRTRGPQKAPTKQAVSVRLDRDVVDALRRTGPGWQTRLNAILRAALSLDR